MALGIVVFLTIPALIILAACVAIAYFRPKESRAGCLLASGTLFLVCALTLLIFLAEWNALY
ncbi:hypothetical protein GCM10009731_24580 [Streptomyces globosus]